MLPTLIFATNNRHKIEEILPVAAGKFHLQSLQSAGINISIEEPFFTLQENAHEKANTIHQLTKKDCFSEDTGLEVVALNGEPGVRSARYADDGPFTDNIDKLLQKLGDAENRKARFRTVICLIDSKEAHYFEGVCKGTILKERMGSGGFGYDPVFVPEGADKTFAEMDTAEKNLYSHRKKATDKLIAFLNKKYGAD